MPHGTSEFGRRSAQYLRSEPTNLPVLREAQRLQVLGDGLQPPGADRCCRPLERVDAESPFDRRIRSLDLLDDLYELSEEETKNFTLKLFILQGIMAEMCPVEYLGAAAGNRCRVRLFS